MIIEVMYNNINKYRKWGFKMSENLEENVAIEVAKKQAGKFMKMH